MFLVPSSPLNMCSVFCFHLASACYIFTWYQRERVENLCSRLQLETEKLISVKNRKKKMDRGMASSLPTEKLDRSNDASWSYKMHQYLLGHGY